MPGFAKRLLMLAISLAYLGFRQGSRSLASFFGVTIWRQSPVVLTFHAVCADETRAFERHMRALKAHTSPVFVETPSGLNGRPTVVVTFDDALQCVFDHALPVMRRLDIPATIFVPTGFAGREPGWIDPERRAHSGRVLRPDTLAACDPRWVQLASHSVSHPFLAGLDRAAVRDELVWSKRALETWTGMPVRLFSFPYGSFNDLVLSEARAAGYTRVFANVPIRSVPDGEPFVIGRITVSPRDWPLEFRLKALGAYQWMSVAVPAKRALWAFWRRTG
jgi:peptidoglycan/xylan/chitin deacetylase (PgdA/CDA1 family)